MSAPVSVPPTVSRHPDALLLRRADAALTWWAAQRPPTPTSSVTGGGAVAAVESAVGGLAGDRPALALPNATYGLRVALSAVGVRAGDDVLVAALDWPAATAAVRSLGAHPLAVDVDETTLTMDPRSAAAARTRHTTALLVTHLHGVCADVPGLRDALGDGLPVIEDAAQAFGATLAGRPAGGLGDVGVFSFGPGKPIDAGELAVLTARDERVLAAAVRCSQHPVRQRLHGTGDPDATGLVGRAAPLSAVLAAHQLSGWRQRSAVLRARERALVEWAGGDVTRLAAPPLRTAVPGRVPVLVADGREPASGIVVLRSGARPVAGAAPGPTDRLRSLTARVRLLVTAEHVEDNGWAASPDRTSGVH